MKIHKIERSNRNSPHQHYLNPKPLGAIATFNAYRQHTLNTTTTTKKTPPLPTATMAASASATFAPTLAECTRAPSLRRVTGLYGVQLPVLPPRKRNITGARMGTNIVVMAAGESLSSGETNESGTELPEIVKSAQEVWDKLDDKYAVVSLGVAFVIVLWGSTGLVSAIDRLPLLPGIFELVGIGYTGWFVYRNIIFKPDREALVAKVKCTFNDVLGSI